MKVYSRLVFQWLLAIILVAFAVGGVHAQGPAKGPPPVIDERKSQIWESLSEEERQALREALRKVWSDPAVISARDEVQQASEAYQKSVRDSILRVDPEAAELLGKIYAKNGGPSVDRKGDRRGGHPPGGMRRGEKAFGENMGFPGALSAFSDEERARFRDAELKVRETSTVKTVLAELAASRAEDEKIRRKRLELYRKLRKTMLAEMVKLDPELEALVKKLRPPGAAPGPRDGGNENGRPIPKGPKRPPVE